MKKLVLWLNKKYGIPTEKIIEKERIKYVSLDHEINGDITIFGNLQVNGNLKVTGDISAFNNNDLNIK